MSDELFTQSELNQLLSIIDEEWIVFEQNRYGLDTVKLAKSSVQHLSSALKTRFKPIQESYRNMSALDKPIDELDQQLANLLSSLIDNSIEQAITEQYEHLIKSDLGRFELYPFISTSIPLTVLTDHQHTSDSEIASTQQYTLSARIYLTELLGIETFVQLINDWLLEQIANAIKGNIGSPQMLGSIVRTLVQLKSITSAQSKVSLFGALFLTIGATILLIPFVYVRRRFVKVVNRILSIILRLSRITRAANAQLINTIRLIIRIVYGVLLGITRIIDSWVTQNIVAAILVLLLLPPASLVLYGLGIMLIALGGDTKNLDPLIRSFDTARDMLIRYLTRLGIIIAGSLGLASLAKRVPMIRKYVDSIYEYFKQQINAIRAKLKAKQNQNNEQTSQNQNNQTQQSEQNPTELLQQSADMLSIVELDDAREIDDTRLIEQLIDFASTFNTNQHLSEQLSTALKLVIIGSIITFIWKLHRKTGAGFFLAFLLILALQFKPVQEFINRLPAPIRVFINKLKSLYQQFAKRLGIPQLLQEGEEETKKLVQTIGS